MRKVVCKNNQRKEFNSNYRKENNLWCGYKVLDDNFNELVDCRFYNVNNSHVVYCCIWAHGDKYFSASGKTSGWGYEHSSAALQDALNNAGLELDENISCCGTDAVEEALKAIAMWCDDVESVHLVKIYG